MNALETAIAPYITIPKALYTRPKYRGISADAMVAYAYLQDLHRLSTKNEWRRNGQIYVACRNDTLQQLLGCSHSKATRIFRELEGYGLIRRQARGQGKCHLIYVLPCDPTQDADNGHSCVQDTRNQEFSKPAGSNNNLSNHDASVFTIDNLREMLCADGTLADIPVPKMDRILSILADCTSQDTPLQYCGKTICHDNLVCAIRSLDAIQIRAIYYGWVTSGAPISAMRDYILSRLLGLPE